MKYIYSLLPDAVSSFLAAVVFWSVVLAIIIGYFLFQLHQIGREFDEEENE